jgi:hypothetical protein
MKRICLTITIVVFIVCAVNAQTEFSVPTPTMEQKYNTTKMFMYNNILALITVAKGEGMTAEEFGKKSGEVFVPGWDENTGFEQFVNFALNSWACLSDDVKIIEQSDDKVVIIVPSVYQQLENQGVLFGSSVEELIAFFNAMHKVIANHFDVGFDMTWGEEGLKTVITK